MLFMAIQRMIEKGLTEGLQEKMDIFLAADRISITQYNQLVDMMNPNTPDA